MSVTIVTGADANFWPLLSMLVDSIRSRPETRELALCVLDLGLEDAQRETLESLATRVVDPGWDIDFPDRADKPGWFKAMVARPFLPQHFPGYDVYLWIDADAWVQDPRILSVFARVAGAGKLAIVPELDRSMIHDWFDQVSYQTRMSRKVHRLGWGAEAAEALGPFPTLNSGVFALRADAPHWAAWRRSLTEALARTSNFMVEQSALNHAVHTHGLPVGFLPMYCNWLCHVALPKVHRAGRRLVEPEPPHQLLGIVHLTKKTKNGTFDLEAIDGEPVNSSLRFGLVMKPARVDS